MSDNTNQSNYEHRQDQANQSNEAYDQASENLDQAKGDTEQAREQAKEKFATLHQPDYSVMVDENTFVNSDPDVVAAKEAQKDAEDKYYLAEDDKKDTDDQLAIAEQYREAEDKVAGMSYQDIYNQCNVTGQSYSNLRDQYDAQVTVTEEAKKKLDDMDLLIRGRENGILCYYEYDEEHEAQRAIDKKEYDRLNEIYQKENSWLSILGGAKEGALNLVNEANAFLSIKRGQDESIRQQDKDYVVFGAITRCDKGLRPSILLLNEAEGNGVFIGGAPALTVEDIRYEKNIVPFGACFNMVNPDEHEEAEAQTIMEYVEQMWQPPNTIYGKAFSFFSRGNDSMSSFVLEKHTPRICLERVQDGMVNRWRHGKETVFINGKQALLRRGEWFCPYAGKVVLETSGQKEE